MFRPNSMHNDSGFRQQFQDIYPSDPHVTQYQNPPQPGWYESNMEWQQEPQFRTQNSNPYLHGFQQQPNFGFGAEAPMFMAFEESYNNVGEDGENEEGELYEEPEPQPHIQPNGHAHFSRNGQGGEPSVVSELRHEAPNSFKGSIMQPVSIPGISMRARDGTQSPTFKKKATEMDRAAELRARLIASREAKHRSTPLQEPKEEITTLSPKVSNAQKEGMSTTAAPPTLQFEKGIANSTTVQTEEETKDVESTAATNGDIPSLGKTDLQSVSMSEQPSQQAENLPSMPADQSSRTALDDLLAEGKAAAEARSKQTNGIKPVEIPSPTAVAMPFSRSKTSNLGAVAAHERFDGKNTRSVRKEKSDASVEPGEILEISPHQQQEEQQEQQQEEEEEEESSFTPKESSKKANGVAVPLHRKTPSEGYPARSENGLVPREPPQLETEERYSVPVEPNELKLAPPSPPEHVEAATVQSRESLGRNPAGTQELGDLYSAVDIEDWLELTGFHEDGYRNKLLHRHRKKRHLEQQLAELDREEVLDIQERVSLRRSQSVRPKEFGRASSVLAMPPPPVPKKDVPQIPVASPPTHPSPTATPARPNVERHPVSAEAPRAKRASSPSSYQPAVKLARRESSGLPSTRNVNMNDKPSTYAQGGGTGTTRLKAVDTNQNYNIKDAVTDFERPPQTKAVIPSPSHDRRAARSTSPTSMYQQYIPARRQSSAHENTPRYINGRDYHSRESSPNRGLQSSHGWPANHDSRRSSPEQLGYPQRPSSRNSNQYLGRKPYRSRGNSYQNPRLGKYATSFKHQESSTSANGGPVGGVSGGYRKGGITRYFLIKSWNYENVEISQREGTWATQEKNTELFTEAYQKCDNVILVFSVNKSMAFQGYARMVSPPSSSVPKPSWISQLLWPTSPPFYIQWIVVSETPFGGVRHLKNECNEGKAVLIGRDGQEIDGVCGKELCRIVDEGEREGGEKGRF